MTEFEVADVTKEKAAGGHGSEHGRVGVLVDILRRYGFDEIGVISTLVLDGVLERFPGLRGGVIEIGAGWAPDMIRRLDHAVAIWAKSEPHLALMKRTPSQQIREQLRFTPYPFEDVGAIVSESFPELYLFSSDYPHAEGGRDPIGRFERSTAGLSETARAGFFARNFLDLYPRAAG